MSISNELFTLYDQLETKKNNNKLILNLFSKNFKTDDNSLLFSLRNVSNKLQEKSKKKNESLKNNKQAKYFIEDISKRFKLKFRQHPENHPNDDQTQIKDENLNESIIKKAFENDFEKYTTKTNNHSLFNNTTTTMDNNKIKASKKDFHKNNNHKSETINAKNVATIRSIWKKKLKVIILVSLIIRKSILKQIAYLTFHLFILKIIIPIITT